MREHDVLCSRCRNVRTWNDSAVCDRCNAERAVASLRARQAEIIEPLFDTREEDRGER